MLHALFIDVFNDRDVKRTSTTLFFKMLQTIFFDFVSILLSCCNETADVAMLHTMNDVAGNIVVCCSRRWAAGGWVFSFCVFLCMIFWCCEHCFWMLWSLLLNIVNVVSQGWKILFDVGCNISWCWDMRLMGRAPSDVRALVKPQN